MESDNLEAIKKLVFIIQKDIFDIKRLEENFILLYQYPTSSVDKFFRKLENVFNIKLKERPDTLVKFANIINESMEKNWWK